MKTWLISAGLAAVLIAGARGAGHYDLTDAEKAAGWKLLFDGQTTNGWQSFKKGTFPAQGWVIEDGALKHLANGGGGDLVSRETFSEFELSWEWKIAKGANSGLKYFVSGDRSSPLGHEYQMIDDKRDANGRPAVNKGGTGSFYDVLPPEKNTARPPGEWNQSRVLVKGNQVEHWLNGERVLAYELGGDAVKQALAKSKFKNTPGFGVRLKGHILLQDHGGEVFFRHIKIRDLSGAP